MKTGSAQGVEDQEKDTKMNAKMDKKIKMIMIAGAVFLVAMSILLVVLLVNMSNKDKEKNTEIPTTEAGSVVYVQGYDGNDGYDRYDRYEEWIDGIRHTMDTV